MVEAMATTPHHLDLGAIWFMNVYTRFCTVCSDRGEASVARSNCRSEASVARCSNGTHELQEDFC